jgi:hypothetical protein
MPSLSRKLRDGRECSKRGLSSAEMTVQRQRIGRAAEDLVTARLV